MERTESVRSRRGSILSATRRLSAIVKNIRQKGRGAFSSKNGLIDLEPKRSSTAPSNETNCTSCVESQEGSRSREGSLASSIPQEHVPATNVKKTPPRTRFLSNLSVQELSEIHEEHENGQLFHN